LNILRGKNVHLQWTGADAGKAVNAMKTMSRAAVGTIAAALLLMGAGCEFGAVISNTDGSAVVVYEDGSLTPVEQRYVYDVVVVDAFNRPVPGAQVALWLENSGTVGRTTTGMEGVVSFDFAAIPGTAFYISAQSGRHLPAAVSDRAGDRSYQTYILTMSDP